MDPLERTSPLGSKSKTLPLQFLTTNCSWIRLITPAYFVWRKKKNSVHPSQLRRRSDVTKLPYSIAYTVSWSGTVWGALSNAESKASWESEEPKLGVVFIILYIWSSQSNHCWWQYNRAYLACWEDIFAPLCTVGASFLHPKQTRLKIMR